MAKIEPPYQPSTQFYVEYVNVKIQKLIRLEDERQEATHQLITALSAFSDHLKETAKELNE